MRTEELKAQWEELIERFTAKFADGEQMDVDGVLFIIGVQEVNLGYKKYKKNEKLDIMHVAICTLLEPYGYYRFLGKDEDGWPHFETVDELPFLKPGEQGLLIKEAIVNYAKSNNWLD